MRALTVWWEGAVVGSLTVDRHGAMRFAYDGGRVADPSAAALSVSLPKRVEPFPPRACRPFFEGLLPEGAQRDAVAAALGVSPVNEFALLERLGGEVAGALTLWPAGEPPPAFEAAGPPTVRGRSGPSRRVAHRSHARTGRGRRGSPRAAGRSFPCRSLSATVAGLRRGKRP